MVYEYFLALASIESEGTWGNPNNNNRKVSYQNYANDMPSLGGRTLNEYNDMSYLTGPETLAICMMRGPPINDNYPILFRATYKDDVFDNERTI